MSSGPPRLKVEPAPHGSIAWRLFSTTAGRTRPAALFSGGTPLVRAPVATQLPLAARVAASAPEERTPATSSFHGWSYARRRRIRRSAPLPWTFFSHILKANVFFGQMGLGDKIAELIPYLPLFRRSIWPLDVQGV